MSDHIRALVEAPPGLRATTRILDRIVPFYFVEPIVPVLDIVVLIAASLLAGIGYHWIFLNYVPNFGPYVAIGVLASLNATTTLTAVGAYKFHALINFKRQARDVTLVWIGVCFILLGIAFFLKVGEELSRGATFEFFIIGFFFLIVWRGALARWLGTALANGTFANQKTILIGERNILLESRVLPELRQYGYAPSAVFEIDEDGHAVDEEGHSIGEGCISGMSKSLQLTLESVIRAARDDVIENILVLISWEHSSRIEAILGALTVLPIPVYLVPDDSVVRYLNRTYKIGPLWMAELKRSPLSKLEQILKRTIDLLGAGVGLLLLSPLLLVTALSIKLDSKGPILFSQSRNGFNGRSFRIYKFRTMTVLEDGPVIRQATRDDPRCTRVGRWLRRTNIDELPQLVNVLRGEMSLVGPRPHAAAHDCEYEQQIAAYAFRYQLKPGITGWAQLNGYRGETRTLDLMSKRIEYDLWYIKNWSIFLDLRILLSTLTIGAWRSRGY
jgi:Undecaprenyl-phosphate glucose phosphotransferase